MERYSFKTKNSKERIIAMSLVGTILLSAIAGCSKKPDQETIDISSTSVGTNIISTDVSGSEITEVTPTPVSYDFVWTSDDTAEFSDYVRSIMGERGLGDYLMRYGFTAELNIIFTNYVNAKYNMNYEYVPFSKPSYFSSISSQDKVHNFGEYQGFKKYFLTEDDAVMNSFCNRLIMSYLIENEIPFGTMVPIENLKALQVEDMYNMDAVDVVCNDLKLGNYDSSHTYTNEDLYSLLVIYNLKVSVLCGWSGTYSLNPLDSQELCNMCNGYFEQYYGNDTLQMGKVLTKDDFAKLFPGYEMNDISYIPGAIYDPNENYPEIDPTVNVINGTIDENLLGEWSTYVEASGFTYTYQFNDDFTGTLTTTHPVIDPTTGQSSEQSGSVDFTYTIVYGILKVTYNTNGNTVSLIYQVKDGVALFNGVEYTSGNSRTRG